MKYLVCVRGPFDPLVSTWPTLEGAQAEHEYWLDWYRDEGQNVTVFMCEILNQVDVI